MLLLPFAASPHGGFIRLPHLAHAQTAMLRKTQADPLPLLKDRTRRSNRAPWAPSGHCSYGRFQTINLRPRVGRLILLRHCRL